VFQGRCDDGSLNHGIVITSDMRMLLARFGDERFGILVWLHFWMDVLRTPSWAHGPPCSLVPLGL
jgi:hypothetical protein